MIFTVNLAASRIDIRLVDAENPASNCTEVAGVSDVENVWSLRARNCEEIQAISGVKTNLKQIKTGYSYF